MEFGFNNGNDKGYQERLNALLRDVFLDFGFWYDLNLWDDRYESHSVVENGEIVSNICVFKADILFNGTRHRALSLGAVATREDRRGRGLSRMLMERIIGRYDGLPMYLSANESVLGFYPRFGFERVYERLPVHACRIDNTREPKRLAFDDPRVWDYVHNRVGYSESLDCLNGDIVNMFHIHAGYLKDSLYELPDLGTMVVAERKGSTLKLIGVFSKRIIRFADLLRHLPFWGIDRLEFGFMPPWPDTPFTMEECESDPFFVRGVPCGIGDLKFPELSVT